MRYTRAATITAVTASGDLHNLGTIAAGTPWHGGDESDGRVALRASWLFGLDGTKLNVTVQGLADCETLPAP